MRGDRILGLQKSLRAVVGRRNVLTKESQTKFYRIGIRVGQGAACAVVLPQDLLQFWEVLKICISYNKIIIVQAANTGLTGGSTPDGDDYDRDVVIISTLCLNRLILLNGGQQVIAFAGATLYSLEEQIAPLGRGPHSIIGSSCIGASVVGGVCNNSGGNLVNRGPAYTELSMYAQLNSNGTLELINHLDLELGNSAEEIISNLQNVQFDVDAVPLGERLAADHEYKERVRDFDASSPARFNADKRRLHEASGCAGKLAVFAVRLDTFQKAEKQQTFYLGTNDPRQLTLIRKSILSSFKQLPDMGEYMHRSYFDGVDKYCKDTFIAIKCLGTNFLPKLFKFKSRIDQIAEGFPGSPDHVSDRILQFLGQTLPDHLPAKMREYRDAYEHHLIIVASDSVIEEVRELLSKSFDDKTKLDYFECNKQEAKAALLNRFVAGGVPARCRILNPEESGELLPLDVALPRNCDSWYEVLTEEILSQMSESFLMGHFLCMVFHWNFVVKKGVDVKALKTRIFRLLDDCGAKYPAEHNVGHLYHADQSLADHYRALDPTNSFNSGIGKMSKLRNYR